MTDRWPVRAGVVGAGRMGRWHAAAISRAGGIVAAVVDHSLAAAQALAATYPGARAGTELAEIQRAAALDVVHLCTPLDTHARLVRQALEAGLHVLVEKPLAETAAVTAELLSLASEHARMLCPTHQFLYQPGVQRGLSALGRLGPLLHVDSVACSAGAVGPFASTPDSLIGEILPHPLALLTRMFPGALTKVDWHIDHPRLGEMRAAGCIGSMSVAVLVSAHGRPTANSMRVIGERGTWEADLFHGYAILEGGTVSRGYKIARPFIRSGKTFVAAGHNLAWRAVRRESAYPGLRALIDRFYRAVRDKSATPITPTEILDVAIARDALMAGL
ncbi:MAG: Gfo/Idh/MocA family protein [Chloroflexota bacterium]